MQKKRTDEQQMKQIIDEQLTYPVYQPIVSLKDGSVFGYEALSRISLSDCSFHVEEMFHLAEKMNCLFRLEAICRSKSIQSASHHPAGCKLLINSSLEVINNQQSRSGMVLEFLEKYGLLPSDVIFEITERTSITDMFTFLDVIRHYTE